MQSRVKWDGLLSDPISVTQGTRQGGVASCSLYKFFINPVLTRLRSLGLGAYIGPFYCGNPTVADDLSILTPSPLRTYDFQFYPPPPMRERLPSNGLYIFSMYEVLKIKHL